jgi:5-methylcytosine-specific restriction endonuclease McrBC regulatory subunit McrC
MTEIKIKDNALNGKDKFQGIGLLTEKVADKTLDQLEKEGVFVFPDAVKDAEDIAKEQMILQSVNDCYRTSNIMGFLGYGKERLIIESRFSADNHDYFFQYLLERVLEFPNILELNTDTSQDNRLLNLLLFLFSRYLKSAMRKGAFKTYIHNQYNDSNVKGTIDIARHVRRNTPFVGKIAYNQREFSFNNYLMELVRHTIEFIKTKPYGNKLLSRVKDEVSAVVKATSGYEYYNRRKVLITNKKNPIRHAYYSEYRELQRLCIMILQHEKHQIHPGIRQVHGIIFDGAWLWEEYINSLIGELFYHPMNKGGKGAQQLFTGKTGKIGLIYPDFISKDATNRAIADAKYKPIGNIGNADYLQILAYMLRFEAKKGFYLYPESNEADNLELRLNSGSTYENNVVARDDMLLIKCGLRIPQNAENHSHFKMQMRDSEKVFTDKLYGRC